MIKILFVCHGNICRSTACEYVMKDIVRREGREADFFIDSAATSREEIGNAIYLPMEKTLKRHGIPIGDHRARQIRPDEYKSFDYLIGMDSENHRNMKRVWGGDPDQKIHSLLSFAGINREVSDPWYTRDFEKAYEDVKTGCQALWEHLQRT